MHVDLAGPQGRGKKPREKKIGGKDRHNGPMHWEGGGGVGRRGGVGGKKEGSSKMGGRKD